MREESQRTQHNQGREQIRQVIEKGEQMMTSYRIRISIHFTVRKGTEITCIWRGGGGALGRPVINFADRHHQSHLVLVESWPLNLHSFHMQNMPGCTCSQGSPGLSTERKEKKEKIFEVLKCIVPIMTLQERRINH